MKGTHYIEASINTIQHRIACWIDEEGGDEMDLDFMCPGKLLDFLIIRSSAGSPGTHVPVLSGREPIPLPAMFARTCTGLRQMWTPMLAHGTRTGWDGARPVPGIGAENRHPLPMLRE
jgi:hypothetical protein